MEGLPPGMAAILGGWVAAEAEGPFITCELTGGLGNQLFQVVFLATCLCQLPQKHSALTGQVAAGIAAAREVRHAPVF